MQNQVAYFKRLNYVVSSTVEPAKMVMTIFSLRW